MGRYTGPSCRQCRRVGEKLFLKGERCFTPRCAIERRRAAPGASGQGTRRKRVSDYGVHLQEKQKVRFMFGVMEKQFRRYVEEAFNSSTVTGEYLMELLERRLDNTIFRLNFGESRKQARQLVLHGHFTVNGRSTNIPSYQVRPGDVIDWKESRKEREFFQVQTEGIPRRPIPEWLELDIANMSGRVVRPPQPAELESGIETRLIVEYYSR